MEDISTVKVTRVINAPIDDVFDAWTEPEQMKQWYSPEGMTTPDASSECRENGKYSVTMKMGEMTFLAHGVYLEFSRPFKLVFSWVCPTTEKGKPTKVTVDFRKIDSSKTEVSLTHSGFETIESNTQHDQGWNGTINKLGKYVGEN